MAASVEGIRDLVEPSVSAAGDGYELWDVEVSADTVRVLVDRDGGIDLDALSHLDAKVISPLLDAHPELTPAGHFSLEVSSPGLERSLRRPEHFARYVGRDVAVKTKAPVEGSRRWQGILRQADGAAIEIETPEGRAICIDFDSIDRARAVLNWGPAEKPGQAGAKKAGAKKAGAKKATVQNAGAKQQAVKRPAADVPSEDDESVAFTERAAE